MKPPTTPLLLALLVALTSLACASVDPAPSFEATRVLVAGRHPGEAAWRRDEAARADADRRVEELLATPLTPDAAAEVALLRNPELQATFERLGVAQADLAQATRLSNPGVSWSRLSGGGEVETAVSLTADVVDWLVLPLRRRLAAAEVERTRLEVGHALLATAGDARLALLAYQVAEADLLRLAEVEEIEAAAFEYGTALHRAGNLTARERASLEVAWAEARAALRRARSAAWQRRQAAALALGLGPEEPWSAAPGLPPPEPTPAVDDAAWERLAAEERLDLAAARWSVTALERALALKRRGRFSPLGVEVGVEREWETGGVTLTGPVVELRLPLFDTGAASVARLEAELAQARWQAAALDAAVRGEVRRRAEEMAAGRELVHLYEETILPLHREVVERSLAEYNQMLIGTFDLLLAKQAAVEAERRSLEARADYWRARFELELAVGRPFAAPSPPAPAAEPAEEHGDHPPARDEDPPTHHHHHAGDAGDGKDER